MIAPRAQIVALLSFIGGDENTSLQGWKLKTRSKIEKIKETLREYAPHETSGEDQDVPPLSVVYSLFAVLSILISEEFDAALDTFIGKDCLPLASLLPKGTKIDVVLRKAYSIVERARLEWENALIKERSKPVHVLTTYEMKLRLQYQGKIPHLLPPKKQLSVVDYPALRRVVWENLFVSIDPFIPPEIAAMKVKTILQQFQANQAKETEESWEAELKAGIVDRNFVAMDKEHERLSFDFRRAVSGNKKTRGVTTFEGMLRRLEVYDYDRRGFSQKEIKEKIPYFKNRDGAEVIISQDKQQAKAIIAAALAGIPVSAVANVRSSKP